MGYFKASSVASLLFLALVVSTPSASEGFIEGFFDLVRMSLTASPEQEEYNQIALSLHNSIRSLHNSRPMGLDSQLSELALHCAGELAQSGQLKHGCAGKFGKGENLFWISGAATTREVMRSAIKAWYDGEKPKYNFNNPGFSLSTGHFTQMLWDESTKLGCGIQRGSNGYYVMCAYEPAGNSGSPNDYRRNVKPQR